MLLKAYISFMIKNKTTKHTKKKKLGVIINSRGTPSYWRGGGKKRYF